jgi:hypothetical protein
MGRVNAVDIYSTALNSTIDHTSKLPQVYNPNLPKRNELNRVPIYRSNSQNFDISTTISDER